MSNHPPQPLPGARRVDSESWRCAGCGSQRIGQRTPDDLCPRCVVVAVTCEAPAAPAEVVRADAGGWISGPGLTTEPVPARDVRAGDRLAYGGRVITVSAAPAAAWYVEHGRHVSGLAITCQAGSAALWVLYRRGGELLDRIRDGA